MTDLDAARWRYAEAIGKRERIASAPLLRALATVPRERFLKTGPWRVRSDGAQAYRLTASADPLDLYDDVLVAIDARRGTPRLFAGITSSHFGPSIAISDDLGASWREPQQAPVAFPERTGRALERVWQIEPGPAEQPERVYVGSQPAALFVSDDGGETFRMVESLWDHPHREHWGAGFGGQAIHTVLPHPADPDSLLVAMSTGGVYRSLDAMVGGNPEALRAWLTHANDHLHGVPAELLRTPQGLVHVADYLDAMRGKL